MADNFILFNSGANVGRIGEDISKLADSGGIVKFLRINADNTVSMLSDSLFRASIGSGATGDMVFSAATQSDALGVLGLYPVFSVKKAEDTSRNTNASFPPTTTLTTDPELCNIPVDANTWYDVQFSLSISTTANSGIWIGIYVPSRPNSAIGESCGAFSLEPGYSSSGAYFTSTYSTVLLATVKRAISGTFTGSLLIPNGATPGMAAVRWSQNTSHSDATILKTGSWISFKKNRTF